MNRLYSKAWCESVHSLWLSIRSRPARTGRRSRRRGLDSGASALEFALISPILILFILGIAFYGVYFWTTNTVQQIANNAARTALTGLGQSEQQTLALTAAAQDLGQHAELNPARLTVVATNTPNRLTVRIAYDMSGEAIWALKGLIPAPAPVIERAASIELGGY